MPAKDLAQPTKASCEANRALLGEPRSFGRATREHNEVRESEINHMIREWAEVVRAIILRSRQK